MARHFEECTSIMCVCIVRAGALSFASHITVPPFGVCAGGGRGVCCCGPVLPVSGVSLFIILKKMSPSIMSLDLNLVARKHTTIRAHARVVLWTRAPRLYRKLEVGSLRRTQGTFNNPRSASRSHGRCRCIAYNLASFSFICFIRHGDPGSPAGVSTAPLR